MRRKGIFLTVVLVLSQFCGSLWARPTTAYQAEKVVTGWLKTDAQPLNTALGQQVRSVESFTNDDGELIYYIVYLQPSGFVIVPADDLVEPIIGFVEQGSYDPSLDNPLGALVTNDLNGRVAMARELPQVEVLALQEATLSAQGKWDHFISIAEAERAGGGFSILGMGSIDDVRVEPLVQSKWGQDEVWDYYCYNYYTPSHRLCGCVATAMAQLMRYHQHPTEGIGVHTFTIYISGDPQDANTRGGDGDGGPYNWSDMVLEPNSNNYSDERWAAIGALCYDAGVTVNMSYKSSVSEADTLKAKYALTNIFGYGNAIKGYNSGSNISEEGLNGMINPNLDAKDPVLLGITDGASGHAVVCDGYGYNSGTLYHHLNMGWSGNDDAWYDLPDINSTPDYSSVYKCIYNIHITGAGDGEIISGCVFDSNGNSIPNPTVYAEPNGESYGVYAESDSKGIYAFDCLDSDTTYIVCPQMDGYIFSGQQVSTGTSIDDNSTSGNVWGVDFYGQPLKINNITPDSGPSGTYMKIEGQNFGTSPGIIMFPGGPENGEEVQWSDTVVYCRVPGDAISGDVKIQTAQFNTSTGKYFEVTSPNEVLVDPNNSTPNIENGTAEYPFSTIGRGMNAAAAGDTVIVNPGIYTEVVDFNGAAITLSSLNPEDPCIVAATILDGNYTRTVITFDDGEDANSILTGFTITDGNHWDGGGIYCTNASPTISYCVVKNNRNSNGNGGGMHNSHSDPTLNKCTFINNTASSYGGAIDNYESSPTLRDCTFIGNSAVYGGGAVCNDSDSNAVIINCVFISNTATSEYGRGGAIYNHSSCPKILTCTFCSNSANDDGGAMYSFFADFMLTIINSTFSGNSAQDDGGAIFNDLGGPTLINCTLSGNEAGCRGDGICNTYNNYNNNVTLTNSILWGNGSEEIYDWESATVVTYSDIKGGWSGSGTNNKDSDPNFVRDPNDGGDGWGVGNDDYGDLHLLPGSPCIDVGDNTAVPADIADIDGDGNTTEPTPWDFDGHPRFIDDPCTSDNGNGTAPFADMGADEYSYLGDLDFSGCVDFVDFAMFAPHWWEDDCGTCDRADLTGDGNVNFSDLREFVANWLAGCEP